MTPTPEQKQWLLDYLYQTMQYRETFEEVYDHILLALEDEPKREFFETNVLNILERDFGGMNGLLQLEENCRQSVDEMATAQYKDNFRQWFAPPLVLCTAVFFVGMVYLELSPVKTGIALFLLFIVLLILPVVICSIRGAKLGYKFGATKESIKDEIFRRLAFKSNRILFQIWVTSSGAELISRWTFNFNRYLAAVVGLICLFLLVAPIVNQYRRRYGADANLAVRRKIIWIPRKEDAFFGWLNLMLIATDVLANFTSNPNRPIAQSASTAPGTVFYCIITVILVLMMINVLATIKLYRSEFKTTMVPN